MPRSTPKQSPETSALLSSRSGNRPKAMGPLPKRNAYSDFGPPRVFGRGASILFPR